MRIDFNMIQEEWLPQFADVRLKVDFRR